MAFFLMRSVFKKTGSLRAGNMTRASRYTVTVVEVVATATLLPWATLRATRPASSSSEE
jgi:hypothetical protein